jgi:two-component system alkaline phosphatase synthesis response regulator PhoP
MSRILIAEDDPLQADLIRRYLEREQHTVAIVDDGRAALSEVRREPPDLLVLDLMLPLVDGLDVCRVLRHESHELPILMVTARSTEDDVLLGLDLGADDYMTKPYSPRELAARVRTLLRRLPHAAEPAAVTTVGRLMIDSGRHEARVDGQPIEVTPAEFRVLEVMAESPGLVFSRSRLLERIHGFDRFISERTIDVHVRNLRMKIELNPSAPVYLLTVYGIGYKLVDPVAPDAR